VPPAKVVDVLPGVDAAVAKRDAEAFAAALERITPESPADPAALAALVERLKEELRTGLHWPGRFHPSAEVLVRLGARGVHPLLEGLEPLGQTALDLGAVWTPSPSREGSSVFSLCGRDAEEVLLDVLLDESEPLARRVRAAAAFAHLGYDLEDRSVTALASQASEVADLRGDPTFGSMCFGALVEGGDHTLRQRLALLRSAPTDENRTMRRIVMKTLDPDFERSRLEPADLWRLLEDPDVCLRATAAAWMRKGGVEDPRLPALLEAAARDPSPDARRTAAHLLGPSTPWDRGWATGLLQRLRDDEDEDVAMLARMAEEAFRKRDERERKDGKER